MVTEAAAEPLGLAILGGIIHATTFATKAYIDGESVAFGKMALTVALGGVIGLLFALSGYTPTAVEWPILLAAYTGFIAELEAALKLLFRGYTYESEERLKNAAREASNATEELAYENRERVIGGLLARAPRATDTDTDSAEPRAPTDDPTVDLSDMDDAALRSGLGIEPVPDPYPGPQSGDRGFEPKDGEPGENGERLHQLYEWLNGNPDWAKTSRTSDSHAVETDENGIITNGP